MTWRKVGVTGAAGCIGSNICRTLLEKGYEVAGVDNLSQGNERNIADFKNNEKFELKKADVKESEELSKALEGCEQVYHLAAFKIPRYGNRLETLMTNALGTRNVLEFGKESNAKILFTSTSDVYGKNPELPFSERSNLVLGPSDVKRWAYAGSKIFDEHLCFAYHEEFGLPVTIIRYFGGYGPGQHLSWWGGPQSVFIDCVLQGKPMTVHGDGKQTRSFTYVKDQARGTILAMEKKGSEGEIFNIGSDREITILELAELIHNISGQRGEKANIELVPYETFGKYEDVMRRVPDAGKAKEVLGFEPEMKLEEGLKITFDWQKRIREEIGFGD